jgi:hypothetical protein
VDASRFDALVRFLGSAADRRLALRGLVAGAVAALGSSGAEAKCNKKKPCGLCKRCLHRHCKPEADGTACGTCQVCEAGSCVEATDGTACGTCHACQYGGCFNAVDGTACGYGLVCQSGECVSCTPLGGACQFVNPAACCSKRCCDTSIGSCPAGVNPCCC